jgi:PadR family transcriptional regulator, regulatory protein PadR
MRMVRIRRSSEQTLNLLLSDRGFLEHKWVETAEAGRPPRHVYRLTAKGVAHAKEQFEISDEIGISPKSSVSRL